MVTISTPKAGKDVMSKGTVSAKKWVEEIFCNKVMKEIAQLVNLSKMIRMGIT